MKKQRNKSTIKQQFPINQVELCVAVIISLTAILLHIRFFMSAGPLWRDEVNSFVLATSKSFSYIWQNLEFDSFPILWHLVVRFWVFSGIGSSDNGIRLLGMITGIGFLLTSWWNAKRMFNTLPMISLLLLGVSTPVICYGDSLRGHGLGMVLGLISFSLIWNVTESPNPKRILIALVAAILSTHMNFYNCIFLMAACFGGMVVSIKKQHWKNCCVILAIGFVTACSMLIYFSMFERANQWKMVHEYDASLSWIIIKFFEGVGFSPDNKFGVFPTHWLWIALALIAIASSVASFKTQFRKNLSNRQRDVILFCVTALLTGTVSYLIFFWLLRYYVQPWYFLIPMTLIGVCLDGIIISITMGSRKYRIIQLAIVCLVVGLSFKAVWFDAGLRKTNIDLAANLIQKYASKRDIILISSWYYSLTFSRYYHGDVDWTIIPPIDFTGLHRYDLIKDKMMSINAIEPIEDKIKQTLRTGGRVWVITEFDRCPDFPDNYHRPTALPAPDSPDKWNEAFYLKKWNVQICHYFHQHSTKVSIASISPSMLISHYEIANVFVVEGWH